MGRNSHVKGQAIYDAKRTQLLLSVQGGKQSPVSSGQVHMSVKVCFSSLLSMTCLGRAVSKRLGK